MNRIQPTLYPILAALVLRLTWGISIPVVPLSDSHAYDVFAQNIAQGLGYGWEAGRPTAYWPVGTSAIYGLLFWLFGHSYVFVVVLQVIVGVAVVALSMALARRWFDDATALATGWLLACWPLLTQYTTVLASELFFVFFVLLAFWYAAMSSSRWWAKAALSGIALAAASYVRPLALVMAPLLYLRKFIVQRERPVALLACAVAVVAMTACVLPWTVRNWQVFDRFVPISTNGGANLWMGNNPSASSGYLKPPELGIANEADRDKALGQQAKEYIAQDPAAFLTRTARKVIALYDRETIGVVWNENGIEQRLGNAALSPLKLISTGYWWAVLVMAAYGVFAFTRRLGLLAALTCPALVTWMYFTLVHSATVANDRYHIPSIPFIAMFAGYAIREMRQKIRQYRSPRPD